MSTRIASPARGPLLVDGPWDNVLVTTARSDDGESLGLGLQPRRTVRQRAQLGFDALVPGGQYRLRGAGLAQPVHADGDGRAKVELDLDGVTGVVLEPAEASEA